MDDQMHYRDLGRLLVKIAGLVILVEALAALPTALGMVLFSTPRNELPSIAAMTLAPIAISLVAGLWMFLLSGTIVDRALMGRTGSTSKTPSLDGIEAVAMSVLGFYLLAIGLKDVAYYVGRSWYAMSLSDASALRMTPNDIGRIGSITVGLLFGLILTLRGRGVAFLLQHLRAAVSNAVEGRSRERS